ncbi:phage portal protein, partial [Corynebacterium freiburgense]
PVAAATHILIPGIHEGILALGKTTIPEALALARGVRRAVETPAHTTELHQTSDKPLTPEKVAELKQSWIRARKGRDGGVAFTSAGIEVKEHGSIKEHLLVEGRNAVAVDLARLCSIPAAMIDATLSGTSLSYSNTQARMAELITFGIAPMISAVTARLGMDDIVPRGVSLRVDTSEATADIAALTVPDDRSLPAPNPHVEIESENQ